MRFYTDQSLSFDSFSCNGKVLEFSGERDTNVLFKVYVSDQDSLDIRFVTPQLKNIEFKVLEYSYDLLSNDDLTVHKRPENMMPKPFINTDAIVLAKNIAIDSLKL